MAMNLGKCIASFMAFQHGAWDLGFLVRQLLGVAIKNVLILPMNFGPRCGDVVRARLYTTYYGSYPQTYPPTT
eukprot:3186280-Karenia_brevis.AAC.1